MAGTAIKVEGVHKAFKLPHEKQTSVKGLFVNMFHGRRTFERQQVLKNVTFEINQGEFFGIVGRNGSGKSTLLKLLAGIYAVDKGQVQVSGKLTPFIELGVGFNPELTGRENVYLNGALLGFDRKQMHRMYDEIVEFAELEKFMDQKLKNYSSGMQVRLAFSIAIQAKSDILLIDEVLAVGDLDFQKKCYDYFFNLKRSGQTVTLVTHDMSVVRKFCDRCLYIENGKIVSIGSPDSIAEIYEEANLRSAEGRLKKQNVGRRLLRDGEGGAEIVSTETFSASSGKAQNTFSASEKIGVRLKFRIDTEIDQPSLGFIFQDEQDVTAFATNNWLAKAKTKKTAPGDSIVLETIIDNVFTDGTYTITAAIESKDFRIVYDRVKYLHRFMVGGHPLAHATTHAPHVMNIAYSKSK